MLTDFCMAICRLYGPCSLVDSLVSVCGSWVVPSQVVILGYSML